MKPNAVLNKLPAGDAKTPPHIIPPPVVIPRVAIRPLPPEVESGRRATQAGKNVRRRMHSASWLSSVTIHLIGLLLLLLVVAPADFGGVGINSLIMTLEHNPTLEEVVVLDTMQATSPANQAIDDDIGMLVDRGLNRSLLSGIGSPSQDSDAGLLGSARGSFFGIEAGGHEFVYVLDVSGSMEGRRFERACDELIRSVEQLGPHQRFYVLLFSSGTVQLFGRTDYLPATISATAENKERLSNWLRNAFQGGGTDPREALRIAMRMNPSAIFMLSDGEFNGRAQQREEKLLGGNADAFSIVSAAPVRPPIHAIAFEVRSSRDNMERLASITSGEFRFVPSEHEVAPAEAIQQAKTAVEQDDIRRAESLLNTAITSLSGDDGSDAEQMRIDASQLLLELAKRALEHGELRGARIALTETVRMDEEGSVTGESQAWLVNKLLQNLRELKNSQEISDTLATLKDLFQRFPNAKTSREIREPLAALILEDARQTAEKQPALDTARKLEFAMTTLADTSVVEACQAEHDRIAAAWLEHAQELRQQQGDVASARYLRQLVADLDGMLFQQQIAQALMLQAREMLAAARDANMRRDRESRNAIQQQIEDGFGNDPWLEKARQELAADERKAQALMRVAVQLERASIVSAAAKYRTLIEQYPGTAAARLAEDRLRFLGW